MSVYVFTDWRNGDLALGAIGVATKFKTAGETPALRRRFGETSEGRRKVAATNSCGGAHGAFSFMTSIP
jgi:hypothetical protein